MKQKGFTLVEGLLLVIAVSIIGFGGFYAYNQSRDDEDRNSSVESANQSDLDGQHTENAEIAEEESVVSDRSENWVSFSPVSKEYSIKLADGWTFLHLNDDYCDCLLSETEIYEKDNDAAVRIVQGGRGGGTGLGIRVASLDESDTSFEEEGPVEDNFVTAGFTGKKYEAVWEDAQVVEPNTKVYKYVFFKNDKRINVSYLVAPSEQDEVEIVEEMIRTLDAR